MTAELKNRVLEVDPNRGRCIVKNCDTSYAIKFRRIVTRKEWKNRVRHGSGSRRPAAHCRRYKLHALEWFWNMRCGTLNLDTPRNIVTSKQLYSYDTET